MKHYILWIGLALLTITTSCNRGISKIEHDKLNYEYNQLKQRYKMLEAQKGGVPNDVVLGGTTKGGDITEVDFAKLELDYQRLGVKYDSVATELEFVNNRLKNTLNSTKSGTVSQAQYDALNESYQDLKKEVETLKNTKPTNTDVVNREVVAKADYDRLAEEVERLKTENQKLKASKNKTTTTTEGEWQRKYRQLKLEHDALVQQKDLLTDPAQLLLLQSKYDELKKEHEDLNERYQSLEDRYNHLNAYKETDADITKEVEVEVTSGGMNMAKVYNLGFKLNSYERDGNSPLKIQLKVANDGTEDAIVKTGVKDVELTTTDGKIYNAVLLKLNGSRTASTLKKKMKKNTEEEFLLTFEKDIATSNFASLKIIGTIDGKPFITTFKNIVIQ